MNTVEFRLREFDTGGTPKGLSVMLAAVGRWVYDDDPLDGVRYEAPLAALKRDLAANGHDTVFRRLITKMLLDNPHRCAVSLAPDPAMEARPSKPARLSILMTKRVAENAPRTSFAYITNALVHSRPLLLLMRMLNLASD